MSVLPVLSAPSPLGRLLTTGQAAALCGVDPKTIARWADAGVVPTHRTVGRRRRLREADLLAFMRKQGIPLPRAPHEAPTIVIVDDDRLVVRSLERLIQRALPSARVHCGYNGFEAGLLIAGLRPDLVLLDIVMPGASGIEVCAALRAMPSLAHTRVIMVSGQITPEDGERLVGADALIAKPFAPDELLRVVRDVLAIVRTPEDAWVARP